MLKTCLLEAGRFGKRWKQKCPKRKQIYMNNWSNNWLLVEFSPLFPILIVAYLLICIENMSTLFSGQKNVRRKNAHQKISVEKMSRCLYWKIMQWKCNTTIIENIENLHISTPAIYEEKYLLHDRFKKHYRLRWKLL